MCFFDKMYQFKNIATLVLWTIFCEKTLFMRGVMVAIFVVKFMYCVQLEMGDIKNFVHDYCEVRIS